MLGNLDELVEDLEKSGGKSVWGKTIYLRNFLQSVNDMGYKRRKFI